MESANVCVCQQTAGVQIIIGILLCQSFGDDSKSVLKESSKFFGIL
ncbi:hypothetical protein [Helicobacter sp. UBA3407]|nr:hypothetical protein [Helicobacter sp. UBA3407]